jgi:hypothetical protein
MRTHRTLPTVALLVTAAIGLAACAAVNEVVTGRDLICTATADDLCLRLASLAMSDPAVPKADRTATTTLTVEPLDCSAISRPPSMRCWMVDGAIDGDDLRGFRTAVYERADGTLVVWH